MKKKFKEELKRQIRFAIAAAVGFIIAFAWRNFIFELTREWVVKISIFAGANLINFFSSLVITVLGVVIIIISSRLLR